MKRGRFIEDPIIGILKDHEAGVSVADLCRKHGVGDATAYKRKAKYSGIDVSEAKRLKGLEDENARLRRLPADAMLDNAALKELREKSGSARREGHEVNHSACAASTARSGCTCIVAACASGPSGHERLWRCR
jgi:putative transposase